MLLKLNLPEFFNTLRSPHILKNCNKVIPALVFISGSTIIKKGNENIYLPAKAIIIAKNNDIIITEDLMALATFFVELFANQLRKM